MAAAIAGTLRPVARRCGHDPWGSGCSLTNGTRPLAEVPFAGLCRDTVQTAAGWPRVGVRARTRRWRNDRCLRKPTNWGRRERSNEAKERACLHSKRRGCRTVMVSDVSGRRHDAAMEPGNNRPQRSLRPAVIARKISCKSQMSRRLRAGRSRVAWFGDPCTNPATTQRHSRQPALPPPQDEFCCVERKTIRRLY